MLNYLDTGFRFRVKKDKGSLVLLIVFTLIGSTSVGQDFEKGLIKLWRIKKEQDFEAPDVTVAICNIFIFDNIKLAIMSTANNCFDSCKKYVKLFTTMPKIISLALAFFILSISSSFAQNGTVSGTVKDPDNKPVEGATITVKQTKVSTVADKDGRFSISAVKGNTITISNVNFEPQNFEVGNETTVEIKLELKSGTLDEVVVVGYGSSIKRDLASATSKVTAKQFQTAVISTVDQALQGRATGIQVTSSSGEPGANTVIRVRGSNSLSGNNEPLYVIDGVIMPEYKEASATVYGSFSQNGLYGLNPNDVESIEVLKDASATAIYGSRGANGVVVITTKAAKSGEGKIEFTSKISTGSILNPLKMMSGKQFAEVYNEYSVYNGRAIPFGNIDTLSVNTNWFEEVTRPAQREDLSLSISGGTPKASYYISGNHLRDKGAVLGSGITRSSIRANLSSVVNKWYTLTAQLSFVNQKSQRGVSSNGGWPDGPGLMEALRTNPLYRLSDNGLDVNSPIPGGGKGLFANPVNAQTDKDDVSINDYSIVNIQNSFKLIPELQLVVNLGRIQNLTRRQAFFPITVAEGFYSNGRGDNTLANTYSYNMSAYFQYDKTFNDVHKLSLTAGGEYIKTQLETLGARVTGLPINSLGVNNLSSASSQQTLSFKSDRLIESGFIRGNYVYKGKYVLNTSIRADGASPFAENKKIGYFPSAGVAWNVMEENFMKNVRSISNLKLRVSYGITGSQAISPYQSLPTYNSDYYQVGSSPQLIVYPHILGNSNLTWEKTKQFNGGLDFSVLNNRITFSFDVYKKRTEGLLQLKSLPSQSGNSVILDNNGTISNKGIELGIQADIIRKRDLNFTTSFNVSHNKNVLVNLGDRTDPLYQALSGNLLGGVYGILTPGEEIGQFYGYKVSGLTQASDLTAAGVPKYPFLGLAGHERPGNWKYEEDKDGKLTPRVLGKSTPDFTYGWSNDITWKRISVNLFFTGSVGNDIINLTGFYLNNGIIDFHNIQFNQTEDWYQNRWTPSNPHNDVRYPGTQSAAQQGNINSVMIENGSFFRLKNMSISYDFPNVKKVVKNLKLFVSGTNIFTITKYTGFDPDVSNFGTSLLQQGIDYGAYPSKRTYTFGLTASF